MVKLPSFVKTFKMELHKKLSALNLLLLMLAICMVAPLSYGQIEISIEENCQSGRTKLKAETQGEFLGWTTIDGDTSSIQSSKTLSTYVNPTQSTTYIAKSKSIVQNQLINGSFDTNE